jgi:small basic protein (TIGR04137 family)
LKRPQKEGRLKPHLNGKTLNLNLCGFLHEGSLFENASPSGMVLISGGGHRILKNHLENMSQHPSLKGKGAIKAKRSVLKRFERVDLLRKRGQFKEGQRVIGLPKTKPED